MNSLSKVAFIGVSILLLISCSKTTKLLNVAKEEGVSSATGWGIESFLKYVDLGYLLSQVDENRVHSVKHGKGVKIVINNWKTNVVFSVTPLNGVGSERMLYQESRLQPGTYILTANIGSGSKQISISENVTLDFYDLARLTQANASAGLGRLKLDVVPGDARITLYGTPHKYHEGMKLPEGSYTVKVNKPGYKDANITISIAKNSLTSESVRLERADLSASEARQKPHQQNHEIVSVTGARVESVAKRTDSTVQTGQLVITPQRADVVYSITSTEGRAYQAMPSTTLPEGDYYVVASNKVSGEVIAQKLLSIQPAETTNTVFSLPALAYQTDLDVWFNFKSETLFREMVEVTLQPKQGETITFRKRMGRRGMKIEAKLLNGDYSAELTGGGIKYSLGDITISHDKSNKFEFVLR